MTNDEPPRSCVAGVTTSMAEYNDPPAHSRWRKGQSGNPSGRPKGSGNFLKDLSVVLGETVVITEGGRQKRITKRRALIKSLLASALKGDVRAAQLMMTWAAAEGADEHGTKGALPPLGPGDLRILKSLLERQPQLKGDDDEQSN